MSQDKRIIKTIANIKVSLCKLLETYKLEDISITLLTKEANISRKTFYFHYNSVASVMTEITNNIYDKLYNFVLEAKYQLSEVDKSLKKFYSIVLDDQMILNILKNTTYGKDLLMIINKSIINALVKKYGDEINKNIPFMLALEYNMYGSNKMFYLLLKTTKNISFDDFVNVVSQQIKCGLAQYAHILENFQ